MSISPPSLGVIEGFFGLDWGWDGRAAMIRFMANEGAGPYIYAPKSDRALRADWRGPWSDEVLDALHHLRAIARTEGVPFGLGLTPMGFTPSSDLGALEAKLAQIETLAPDVLAVLLDDTRDEGGALAQRHADLMHRIAGRLTAGTGPSPRLWFCPAYYSDDPILDQVFGARPRGYLEALGQALDPSVGVFWTGPKVVSPQISADHLRNVAARLGRKPVIWDNSMVNDSRALSPFLPLQAPALDGAALAPLTAAWVVNPINQPGLARITLLQRMQGWRGQTPSVEAAVRALCGPALADALLSDAATFEQTGYPALSAAQRIELGCRYSAFLPDPMAAEVIAWAEGRYIFDPACLT